MREREKEEEEEEEKKGRKGTRETRYIGPLDVSREVKQPCAGKKEQRTKKKEIEKKVRERPKDGARERTHADIENLYGGSYRMSRLYEYE